VVNVQLKKIRFACGVPEGAAVACNEIPTTDPAVASIASNLNGFVKRPKTERAALPLPSLRLIPAEVPWFFSDMTFILSKSSATPLTCMWRWS
jgi:hypothetical protein